MACRERLGVDWTPKIAMKSLYILVTFVLLTAQGSDGRNYFGKRIGRLSELEHGVKGEVYAVDSRTIHIRGFSYDGAAPDAFFYAGTSGNEPHDQGIIIPDENGNTEPLKGYSNKDVTLTLPDGLTFKDILWISVWCRAYTINFGHVMVPRNFDYPRPQKIEPLPTFEHGVSSDRIVVVDAQTFLIPNFHYDGAAPDAFFWVGKGSKPEPAGTIVPDENGSTEPLKKYTGKTIVITLPGDMTVFDVDHLGVWCRAFYANFGHVMLPKTLNVPPSLKMLGVAPQNFPGTSYKRPSSNFDRPPKSFNKHSSSHFLHSSSAPKRPFPPNPSRINQFSSSSRPQPAVPRFRNENRAPSGRYQTPQTRNTFFPAISRPKPDFQQPFGKPIDSFQTVPNGNRNRFNGPNPSSKQPAFAHPSPSLSGSQSRPHFQQNTGFLTSSTIPNLPDRNAQPLSHFQQPQQHSAPNFSFSSPSKGSNRKGANHPRQFPPPSPSFHTVFNSNKDVFRPRPNQGINQSPQPVTNHRFSAFNTNPSPHAKSNGNQRPFSFEDSVFSSHNSNFRNKGPVNPPQNPPSFSSPNKHFSSGNSRPEFQHPVTQRPKLQLSNRNQRVNVNSVNNALAINHFKIADHSRGDTFQNQRKPLNLQTTDRDSRFNFNRQKATRSVVFEREVPHLPNGHNRFARHFGQQNQKSRFPERREIGQRSDDNVILLDNGKGSTFRIHRLEPSYISSRESVDTRPASQTQTFTQSVAPSNFQLEFGRGYPYGGSGTGLSIDSEELEFSSREDRSLFVKRV